MECGKLVNRKELKSLVSAQNFSSHIIFNLSILETLEPISLLDEPSNLPPHFSPILNLLERERDLEE